MKQVIRPAGPTGSGIMKLNGRENGFQSLPASQQFVTRTCLRCEGLLVSEWSYDLQNPLTHYVESLRCVQCGNRLDPVILQNQPRPSDALPSKRQDRPTSISPLKNVAYPIAGVNVGLNDAHSKEYYHSTRGNQTGHVPSVRNE